jgi:hypothetical protein
MATPMEATDATRYEWARRRAAHLRGFYIHALAFVLGNTANFVVNWMTLGHGDNPWWFQWALIAWSVALCVHGITVLGKGAWLGPKWEDRKIRQYLADTDHTIKPQQGEGRHSGDEVLRP